MWDFYLILKIKYKNTALGAGIESGLIGLYFLDIEKLGLDS